MKNKILLVVAVLLLFSCTENTNSIKVKNIVELNKAIENAVAGDEIVLANGVWKDVKINFYGLGTEEKPITLRAETPGNVFVEGQSYLQLGGEYLIVDGLYFKNGYTPISGVIRYMIGKDSVANNSKVTNTVIEDFTQPNRLATDQWIEFYGKQNKLEYCYISGKSNDGETLRVYLSGNEHINNHHQIVNNYFGPRPRKGGPRAETMRVGASETSFAPSFTNVSNNYFEACNGEVEIISNKTNFNSFNNNIFYKCEGSLVLRHGDYATLDGNIFIGGDESEFYGGIRVVNSGNLIVNNYFYKINGAEFRTPLAVMNGIFNAGLNRYKQVTDGVIAYNTWVDCKSPIQIGVGQNIASADVLPASEIRDLPPIRTIIANNIIYNTVVDEKPLINHSSMDGILFQNNLIDNNGKEYSEYNALQSTSIKMKKVNEWLYAPNDAENKTLNEVYLGYDFGKIQLDIFGTSRKEKNSVGAICNLAEAEIFKIDKKKYGPNWFNTDKKAAKPKTLIASSKEGDLAKKISQAANGDFIELNDALYTVNTSIAINKKITLQSKNKAQIVFTGGNDSIAFKMHPKGTLKLENLVLKGEKGKIAFAPLKENMGMAYNVFVENSVIEDFDFVLKATKGSFADELNFKTTTIKNCLNGIVLAADDKGDYNAEFVTFEQCEFVNVQKNVIHFFRDGYDESTIGGYLVVKNSSFMGCGKAEKSGVLVKSRGIINFKLFGNTFKNNPIKNIAILWGEKNNHYKDNTVINSGIIKVEEQQKLKILY
ncbi:chondroitinase-B domain-containing protein [Lutibacter sp.]|uniref:chondroitinase-B domain-containing protein n=1 Tax=Lutibacter sp. TaxID=1925666 RepID=UPI00356874DC